MDWKKCSQLDNMHFCTASNCQRGVKVCCFACKMGRGCQDICSGPDIEEKICSGPYTKPRSSGAATDQCSHHSGISGCDAPRCKINICCINCGSYGSCENKCPEIGRINTKQLVQQPSTTGSGAAIDQKHYQVCNMQPIEIMQMYMTPEEFRGFLKGCLIKYSLRANFKGDQQKDIDKAHQYAKWLRQALRGEKIDPRAVN